MFLMVIDFLVKFCRVVLKKFFGKYLCCSFVYLSHLCFNVSWKLQRFFPSLWLKKKPNLKWFLVHWHGQALETDQRLSPTSGNSALWAITSNTLLQIQVKINYIKEELLPLLSSSRNLCVSLVFSQEQIWMISAHFSTLLLRIIFSDNFSLFTIWNLLCLILFYNNHS